jgi:hypothetical protein
MFCQVRPVVIATCEFQNSDHAPAPVHRPPIWPFPPYTGGKVQLGLRRGSRGPAQLVRHTYGPSLPWHPAAPGGLASQSQTVHGKQIFVRHLNSWSHRHRASWSTELKALAKSIYTTHSCCRCSAACAKAQCMDCTWRCVECSLRNPSCEGPAGRDAHPAGTVGL